MREKDRGGMIWPTIYGGNVLNFLDNSISENTYFRKNVDLYTMYSFMLSEKASEF
jgi:hypothetical protein